MRAVMSVLRQNADGTWSPAEPVGWREEHNRFVRLLYWIIRRKHCPEGTRP